MPSIPRSLVRCALLLAFASPPLIAMSCARSNQLDSNFDDGGGSSSSGGSSDATVSPGDATPTGDGGGLGIVVSTADGGSSKCNAARPCYDFSSTPIMDPAAPPSSDPSAMFGDAGTGTMMAGPCLVEPADGALYPKNWLRPRILWTPGSSSQNLFEVRIHSDGEANDLVVYTKNQYWVMDKPIWQTIATGQLTDAGQLVPGNLVGQTLSVTVRALGGGGGAPAISNTASFTVAPASADGALVYWTTASFANTASNTTLQGFRVGDEGTTTALQANQVQQPVRAQSVDGGNLMPASFNGVFCIGCHSATPDGNYVSFTTQWPWANALASIQAGEAGAAPPWLTIGAVSNLSPNLNGYYQPANLAQVMMGIQTFSPAHYTTGDRRLVAAIGAAWNQTEAQIEAGSPGTPTGVISELAWFDLEWTGPLPDGGPYNPWGPGTLTSPLPLAPRCTGTGEPAGCATSVGSLGGWGIIARQGDPNSAGAPNWSHNVDGKTDVIAYSSTNLGTKDGRMDCQSSGPTCTSDVYLVPYADGVGGTATPLSGASDPAQNEYYPAWSPDDQLIAFNRVPKGTSMYNEPKADVYVVPYNGGAGGNAVRLVANDPVACTGAMAGSVQNTWPKWAPNPLDPTSGKPVPQTDANGNTYYWITFSSIRSPTAAKDPNNGGKRRQQLYVAGIVVASDGSIHTYAPIYLWNQDDTVNNLIPAWGEFQIPPGVTPPPAPTAQ
ncbi:MAG TPA: hypothetical protein VE987_21635 [Polyangiaceae bacterium]|nr:hypothetical protein [Polyangiaceae bacterium]